ncbi:MAG: hypothetical protein M4579_006326 [Chaenotheca gracillima]|nr:MAG: hypothetical protein M4579_006326 [Chaenotheca gracillima]
MDGQRGEDGVRKIPVPKRACDACHRRKVRCLGGHPCRNCTQAGLACTFLAIPRKKGPKGSRAKIISELREAQQHMPQQQHQQQQQMSLSGAVLPFDLSAFADTGMRVPPERPAWAPTPGLLTPEMITACLDFFFAHMYPTMPILHRESLERRLAAIDQSTETYCLITALCAFMMIQPGMKVIGSTGEGAEEADGNLGSSITTGSMLLDEVLRVRKSSDYIENPSVATVTTSFFIFGCYFGLDKHNTAWFHLREATTLAQILGMQEESTYLQGNPIESSRQRRLFWILFVTERPLTLHATIEMPRVDEDPNETTELFGFVHLVNLFRPFNDTFVGLWNRTRADCSTAWLAQLQNEVATALPATLNCTESQAADLRTSQHWLRTRIWELSITNGYLSSTSPDSSMTFKYPIEISRDLIIDTGALSRASMEVHGVGLIEKLFDVAWTLTEVMSCIPLASQYSSTELGPRDYLNTCLHLVSTLRGGDSRFLPILQAKVQDTLPTFGLPVWRQLDSNQADREIREVSEGSSSGASSSLELEPSLDGSPEAPSLDADGPFFYPLLPDSQDNYGPAQGIQAESSFAPESSFGGGYGAAPLVPSGASYTIASSFPTSMPNLYETTFKYEGSSEMDFGLPQGQDFLDPDLGT